jgi:hypothetical protein
VQGMDSIHGKISAMHKCEIYRSDGAACNELSRQGDP